MEYQAAEDLLKAIQQFDRASDDESEDAEYTAACNMREAAASYLRASASRDVALAELVDRELA